MGGGFDQIGAAIPFRALALVRFKDARPEEHQVPAAHQHAVIERPAQLRRGRGVLHRRYRVEVGLDRQHIWLCQFCEMRVGERGVIAGAVAAHAQMDRAVKILIAPAAEASVAIGGEVRRVDGPERRVYPPAAGKGFCRVRGMATAAIGGFRERLATCDRVLRRLCLHPPHAECTAQNHAGQKRVRSALPSPHRSSPLGSSIASKPGGRWRHVVSPYELFAT